MAFLAAAKVLSFRAVGPRGLVGGCDPSHERGDGAEALNDRDGRQSGTNDSAAAAN